NFLAYLTRKVAVATYWGEKGPTYTGEGPLETTANPDGGTAVTFPASLCTRPWCRCCGSRARGTTIKDLGHDQRQTQAATHPSRDPRLPGLAVARHRRLPPHDRPSVRGA